ncbi:TlpA family protein disulfide reductase [Mycolicibacterium aichiense]|uniref:Membrane protein n=1 Tax=Mycolicibacterium aichiense TaxID=1799 RepID=A0AAD1MAK6_9MYCO|nr:TlpA disulfide reductase family protein [Mycolicibacterium aichiense]MCV7021038.1 TlpA family protein disulfide reductase [Mycolicibacterium aichiense]BBX05610.1 membrane protein [Mycolicibacterium aichiense]STZ25043.1 membrane-anchored thioredoxin-like protein (thiol-disulfide interchange related protein) [Mycolicibacterium aichiense]
MTTSTRWTLVVLAVAAALIAAFALELGDTPSGSGGSPGAQLSRTHRDADTPEALAEPRRRADLPPCPAAADNPGPKELRGIVVECAGDGAQVDVARALAGRPVVLNLWAYWCGPCTEELPAMADYQRRVGPDVAVVTVHQDENETAGLLRLAELGVRLPTLQDGQRRIAAALGVPNVMPATVILRADGSVAKILPQAFTSADEIAAAVKNAMQ